MDGTRFPTLTRSMPVAGSRRRAVVAALGGSLAALGLRDTRAKKRKKRKGKGTGPGGLAGPPGPPPTISIVTREGTPFSVVGTDKSVNAAAACNAGEQVTAGGVRVGSGGAIAQCHAAVSVVEPDGITWVVTMWCPSGTNAFVPWVRCLSVIPA